MTKNKRIILTVGFLLSIFIFLCFKYNTQIKKFFGYREFKIKTVYGDTFLVKAKDNKYSLTDQTKTYRLYYLGTQHKKDFLVEFIYRDFKKFDYQYKDKLTRTYIIGDYIVFFRDKTNTFQTVLLYNFDFRKQNYLIPAVKFLLFDEDIDLVKNAAELLIKSKNSEIIQIIKRYSEGNFTKLQKKFNIPIKLEYFQKFCKDLLRENEIDCFLIK